MSAGGIKLLAMTVIPNKIRMHINVSKKLEFTFLTRQIIWDTLIFVTRCQEH